MAKNKAGLQKKVSTIFGNAPISKNDDTEQLPAAPKEESPDSVSVEPSMIEQSPSSSSPPRQTTQPSPATVSSKQPVKTGAVVKSFGQISLSKYWKKIQNKLFASKPGVDTKRQKTMVLLMPVLVIIFIFVAVRLSSQLSPKTSQAQSLGATEAGGSVAVSEKKINWQKPQTYPAALRDPMQASLSVAGQEGGSNLIVKGIVFSEDRASAVIGDQIVHEGDKISEITVVKINRDNVEFEINGKKWTQSVQR